MILFKLFKNKNEKMEGAFGKVYARPVVTQTINLDGLAEHMAEHNTGFSPGSVKGLLTDMVRCIKELVLKGIAVKIDDLAIFSIGLRTKSGADSTDDFSVAKNIAGVKLRARATGSLTSEVLDLDATLTNIDKLTKGNKKNTDGTNPDGTDPGDSDNKGDSKGDNTQGSGSKDDTGGTSNPGGSTSGGGSSSSGSGSSSSGDGDDPNELV